MAEKSVLGWELVSALESAAGWAAAWEPGSAASSGETWAREWAKVRGISWVLGLGRLLGLVLASEKGADAEVEWGEGSVAVLEWN